MSAQAPGDTADWHLYMVRTRHDALYTGITVDVERRFAEHGADGPRGARYLRGKGPLTLEYVAAIGPKGLALRVEQAVKRLSPTAKRRLVERQPTSGELCDMLGIDGQR